MVFFRIPPAQHRVAIRGRAFHAYAVDHNLLLLAQHRYGGRAAGIRRQQGSCAGDQAQVRARAGKHGDGETAPTAFSWQ
jgi:hypothetical protein